MKLGFATAILPDLSLEEVAQFAAVPLKAVYDAAVAAAL